MSPSQAAKPRPWLKLLASGQNARIATAVIRLADLLNTVTCKNQPKYLKSTLEAIAAGHPKDRIDELLPWNFNLSS